MVPAGAWRFRQPGDCKRLSEGERPPADTAPRRGLPKPLTDAERSVRAVQKP
jgi:hypothetical protein